MVGHSGGVSRAQIVLVDYDPEWAVRFDVERVRITDALGPRAIAVDHVRSTSVPGLAAKPIIDEHRLLRTAERDLNLHVFSAGSSEAERMLVFRDWLRSNPADRELYASTKRALAQRSWSTVQDYADAKTEVVATIVARALAARDR